MSASENERDDAPAETGDAAVPEQPERQGGQGTTGEAAGSASEVNTTPADASPTPADPPSDEAGTSAAESDAAPAPEETPDVDTADAATKRHATPQPAEAAQATPFGAQPQPAETPAKPPMSPATRRTLVLVVVIAIIVVAIVVAAVVAGTKPNAPAPETPEEEQPSASSAEQASSAQETPTALSAPSARTQAIQAQVSSVLAGYTGASGAVSVTYLVADDPTDGFAVAGDESRTSASMIKLLILADLLQQVHDGSISLDTPITMEAEDVVGGSGEIQGSPVGTAYTVNELANYMIAASDNTATNMLIDALGMDSINDEADALGLTGTALERKMMDSEAQARGLENRISSNDAAKILQMIASGTLIDKAASEKALAYLKNQEIDAGLAAGIDDPGVVVAHKTGELDGVENDGGIVFAAQGPYVLVVLTEGLSNGTEMQLIEDVSRAVYGGVSAGGAVGAETVAVDAQPGTEALPTASDATLAAAAPDIQQ